MKLYGLGPTRSIRALWGLLELGVEFEFVPVNLRAGEHRHPDFLRLNPAGKLPVLVDGDFVLTESAAIVLYLAEKYSAKGLLPSDLKVRAQVYRWVMGFYPVSADGLIKAKNFRSRRVTLRRIRGLWNRSM